MSPWLAASRRSLGKRKTIEAWGGASKAAPAGASAESVPSGDDPPEGGLSESEDYSRGHPQMPSFFWFWADGWGGL
jgi:hypothetical protein